MWDAGINGYFKGDGHMSVESMLAFTAASLLILEERRRKDIVVGVPHHAPGGMLRLPCPEHKISDENAGFLGRYIAEKLDACSVIACNYRIDANKDSNSDYSRQIARWNPRFLVEIHGHSGTKAKSDIEISSGSLEMEGFSKDLAARLSEKFLKIPALKKLSVCGDFEKIYFKAKGSVTISDGPWVSFHIELPRDLRRPEKGNTGKPPSLGYRFSDCLVESLNEMYR
jgi:hypothetical protein